MAALVVLAGTVLSLPAALSAQADNGDYYHGPVEDQAEVVQFSDGSTIEYFQWPSPDRLLMWTVNEDGAILWEQELGTGDRDKVLSASRVDELLGAGTDFYSVRFRLSPDGSRLALWRSPEAPLAGPFFGVLELDEPGDPLVEFDNFHPAFQVGAFAWGEDSTYMYVAAAPYSGPENPFSLGRFSLKNDSFIGMLNRDQVDLIDQLVYHHPSRSIVFTSQAHGMDYPLPPTRILGRVDLDSMELSELGRFDYIRDLNLAPDEDTLYFTQRPGDSDGDGEVTERDHTTGYRMDFGGDSPQAINRFTGISQRVRRSPDGEFLAWMQIYDPLVRPPRMTDQKDLWAERTATGERYRVAAWVEDYRFAPESKRLAVLVDNNRRLLLFDLGRSSE